eukprot:TRINITY_DN3804_c0_g1_i2.p1 TRINITY_DN3804_c0_g1~~TRINITY_DN3804_c0_g1_i2.p1  ORF type:complete len:224 (+),score=41.22 TRINITY_DN3804_c0_g1_i2:207-878(+)
MKQQGTEIAQLQVQQVQEQIKNFTEHLEKFAIKYKDNINSDPEFRKQFSDMCKTIGVDPLKSSKGFWADVLGVGDFYYELGIQIVEICMKTRELNGGLIEMESLVSMLREKRGDHAGKISRFDVERSVQKLSIFGNGYTLVKIGESLLVQSMPMELSPDHTTIIGLANKLGYVTAPMIEAQLGWTPSRVNLVTHQLLKEGIAWLDNGAEDGITQFWFPGIVQA